jgi:hypothetical protein
MRQSITLTSFGTGSMNELISSIYAIHHLFARVLPENSMEPWSPTMFDECPAVDMGNRYFTNRKDISLSEALDFKTSVDPNGILTAAMAGTEFAHTVENEVAYFELIVDADGNKQ